MAHRARRTFSKKTPVWLSSLALTAAILGGCGGDTSSTSTSSEGTASTTSTGVGGTGGRPGSSSVSSGTGGMAASSSVSSGTGGMAASSSVASGTGGMAASSSVSSGVGGMGGSSSVASGTGGMAASSSASSGVGGMASSTSSSSGGMGGAGSTTASGAMICIPGDSAICYSGPAGTSGVGQCKAGTHTCNALGTAYGPCEGEVLPQVETCATPFDDDCNGQTNESGAGCVCPPSAAMSCYSGPAGTAGVGLCAAGTKTCNAQGTAYSACVGEVLPQAESCSAPGDENCNGQINEGCSCAPGSTTSCYSGPAGTAGVGLCHAGTQTCNAQGTAYGACTGEVTPQVETCTTPGDDDCNGQTNESGTGCICAPGATLSCYSGPAGTQGVGACKGGTKTCNALGTAYGACAGEVVPQAELCATPGDDNCDGQINEGCACAPGSTLSCYSGPVGTSGVGICAPGTKTCNAQGTYGACVGDVVPQPLENCNTPGDDNCDGSGCTGTTLLSREWGAPTDDEGFAVTTDTAGNIIIAGYMTGTNDFGCGPLTAPASGEAALIVKLGPTGNCLWNKVYGDVAHINGVVVDTAGSVYVTGFFFNTIDFGGGPIVAGSEDVFVAKYSSTGVYQWGKRAGDAAFQESGGIGIDSANNIYLTGLFYSKISFGGITLATGGTMDVYLAKLTSAGVSVWTKGFGDASAQRAYAIATDSAGNSSITGVFQGSINFGGAVLTSAGLNDVFVARFNSAGVHQWSKKAGDSTDQIGSGIAVDEAGNTYVTGSFSGTMNLGSTPSSLLTSQGGYDVFLSKLDNVGNNVWSKSFGDVGNQLGVSVAVDWSGSVDLTSSLYGSTDFGGGVFTSLGATDVVISKYTSAGNYVWGHRYGDAGTDTPRKLWVDPAGNLFMTGVTTESIDLGQGPLTWTGGEDIFLVKLGP